MPRGIIPGPRAQPRGSGIILRGRGTKSKGYKTFLARSAYIALSDAGFITSVLYKLEFELFN
jgi:hypothetical protein